MLLHVGGYRVPAGHSQMSKCKNAKSLKYPRDLCPPTPKLGRTARGTRRLTSPARSAGEYYLAKCFDKSTFLPNFNTLCDHKQTHVFALQWERRAATIPRFGKTPKESAADKQNKCKLVWIRKHDCFQLLAHTQQLLTSPTERSLTFGKSQNNAPLTDIPPN